MYPRTRTYRHLSFSTVLNSVYVTERGALGNDAEQEIDGIGCVRSFSVTNLSAANISWGTTFFNVTCPCSRAIAVVLSNVGLCATLSP